jgi:hypothetical protein
VETPTPSTARFESLGLTRPNHKKQTPMKSAKTGKALSPAKKGELLVALKARFERNLSRHESLDWPQVRARLEANPEKLWSLGEMENTGGEPDVV